MIPKVVYSERDLQQQQNWGACDVNGAPQEWMLFRQLIVKQAFIETQGLRFKKGWRPLVEASHTQPAVRQAFVYISRLYY